MKSATLTGHPLNTRQLDSTGVGHIGSGPGVLFQEFPGLQKLIAMAFIWYTSTMLTTIDKAGRVVIPAAIRAKAGLKPGTELEVTFDQVAIRLERKAPGPKLVRVGNRLVARPVVAAKDRPDVDIAALVEEERNRWPW